MNKIILILSMLTIAACTTKPVVKVETKPVVLKSATVKKIMTKKEPCAVVGK